MKYNIITINKKIVKGIFARKKRDCSHNSYDASSSNDREMIKLFKERERERVREGVRESERERDRE